MIQCDDITMAYALRSKGKLQTEHIYATIAKRQRQLLCVNITGVDREDDYALCFKHKVVGIDKDYVTDYRPNDLINIYTSINREYSLLLISRIMDITPVEPDDYLNDGGRKGRYYVHFCPIAELQHDGEYLYRPKFYMEDGEEFSSSGCKVPSFKYDLYQASRMVNAPPTHNLTYAYNSWFNENYPETRKLSYDVTVCLLFRIITNICNYLWKKYKDDDYIHYRSELFSYIGDKVQVNKWKKEMDALN